MQYSFGSDNHSGIHPKIMQALQTANTIHTHAYGDDDWTKRAREKILDLFQAKDAFFVLTGTGANVTGMHTLLRPWNSILCTDVSHIWMDECAAVERLTGCKLIALKHQNGKIDLELAAREISDPDFEHHAVARIISITQPTELGTLYSREELQKIREFASRHNLLVHMDGARIANALSAMKMKPFELGNYVDFLSLGGTKNAMMIGECTVFFCEYEKNSPLYARKQAAQLYSKMRFIAAQFLAWFEEDLWLSTAEHANQMANLLAFELKDVKNLKILYPVDTNGVFVCIPKTVSQKLLEEGWFFYTWDEEINLVRWMCSFDTSEEVVRDFASRIRFFCNQEEI